MKSLEAGNAQPHDFEFNSAMMSSDEAVLTDDSIFWSEQVNQSDAQTAADIETLMPNAAFDAPEAIENEEAAAEAELLQAQLASTHGRRAPVKTKQRLLTAEEEKELAKRIERGDLEAKERMILSNIGLAKKEANRNLGKGLEFDELTQMGIVGLIRASEKFDWRKGFKFSTYATWWIRQAIDREIAQTGQTIRLPQHLHEAYKKIQKSEMDFYIREGHEPGLEELATEVGMDGAKVAEILRTKHMASLNMVLNDNKTELGDMLEDPNHQDEGFHALAAADSANIAPGSVKAALQRLPDERQRFIIQRRFGLDGSEVMTQIQIGEELGITVHKVQQLEKVGLAKLREVPEMQAALELLEDAA